MTILELAQAVQDKADGFSAAKAKADSSMAQAQADQAAESQAHADLHVAIGALVAAAQAEDPSPAV